MYTSYSNRIRFQASGDTLFRWCREAMHVGNERDVILQFDWHAVRLDAAHQRTTCRVLEAHELRREHALGSSRLRAHRDHVVRRHATNDFGARRDDPILNLSHTGIKK